MLRILKFITEHPLNTENKLSSIMRFVRWQIGSRLVPGVVVYDWINGARFLVRTGETGLTGNIYTGLHEFPDMGFLLHVLRSDDLFIDVGANVGSYTILACAVIGARGYAFEPIPGVYKRLMDNIRINYLDERVEYYNLGVGARPGNMIFTSDRDTTNHALAPGEQSDETVDVAITSLDAALEGENPNVLKIDVEGYETPVLEGAGEILQKKSLHSVIMELNGSGKRYGFDESRILAMMLDYGFRTYAYDPFARTLLDINGKNNKSGNTLFVRDKSLVMDRIKSAPTFSIHGKQF